MIEIVSATRLSPSEFAAKSALGLSLQRLGFDDRLKPALAFANRIGLPAIYNSRIVAPGGPDILVFIHDDVWIDDLFFVDRVIEGLRNFDLIGVAGNRRRVPNQPSWSFVSAELTWDERANLSGAVAHGYQPFGAVSHFGPAPAACELLDGVLLAARKSLLVARKVLFDPRFDFHFYDLDFCRAARQAGLRLGTWPISITHQSGGAFGGERWRELYRAYLAKWGA
jgi:GT2 family glycosyltransferase